MEETFKKYNGTYLEQFHILRACSVTFQICLLGILWLQLYQRFWSPEQQFLSPFGWMPKKEVQKQLLLLYSFASLEFFLYCNRKHLSYDDSDEVSIFCFFFPTCVCISVWGTHVEQTHMWVPIYSSDNYVRHWSSSTSHSYHGDQVISYAFKNLLLPVWSQMEMQMNSVDTPSDPYIYFSPLSINILFILLTV